MSPYDYWERPPPTPSPGLLKWLQKIKNGFIPNRRLGSMGYDEASHYYKVYIWEYINILRHEL